jgi:quercetin dioxygenase-like cupin family protein
MGQQSREILAFPGLNIQTWGTQMSLREAIVAECTHYRWADVKTEQLNPLVRRQYVTGEKTMLARLVLKKGAHVPQHEHFHEQLCHVLEGALEFGLEEGRKTVRAGEILCIPPHAPHEVVALEDSTVLDIFNPPRQDWIDGDDAYLRQA